MIEIYNFSDNSNNFSFFNSLLLNGDIKKITEIKGFDPSALRIELKVNGISIGIENFNSFMNDWYCRVKDEIREEFGVTKAQNAIEEAAIKLLKKKCGTAIELLYYIENCEHLIYGDD